MTREIKIGKTYCVIDDITGRIVKARITGIEKDGVTLKGFSHPETAYWRRPEDIYDTPLEASRHID